MKISFNVLHSLTSWCMWGLLFFCIGYWLAEDTYNPYQITKVQARPYKFKNDGSDGIEVNFTCFLSKENKSSHRKDRGSYDLNCCFSEQFNFRWEIVDIMMFEDGEWGKTKMANWQPATLMSRTDSDGHVEKPQDYERGLSRCYEASLMIEKNCQYRIRLLLKRRRNTSDHNILEDIQRINEHLAISINPWVIQRKYWTK